MSGSDSDEPLEPLHPLDEEPLFVPQFQNPLLSGFDRDDPEPDIHSYYHVKYADFELSTSLSDIPKRLLEAQAALDRVSMGTSEEPASSPMRDVDYKAVSDALGAAFNATKHTEKRATAWIDETGTMLLERIRGLTKECIELEDEEMTLITTSNVLRGEVSKLEDALTNQMQLLHNQVGKLQLDIARNEENNRKLTGVIKQLRAETRAMCPPKELHAAERKRTRASSQPK